MGGVIGDELKRLRLARGYSLRRLAELSGVDAANLSQIETGKRDAQASTLERVADALGARVTLAAKND